MKISIKEKGYAQEWWYIVVIPALGRLSQEDLEFKFSLGYKARHCLKETKMKIFRREKEITYI
jgi:hypothetical protein